MSKPRAFTEAECREKFLAHIRALVRYWESEDRAPTVREKLDGLAFSILSAIDGSAMALPGFQLIPAPHPDDKPYHIENGENYWPSCTDIAGSLHEQFSAGGKQHA